MKRNFKTPILITGFAACGIALQIACQAQGAVSASAASPLPSAPMLRPPVQVGPTELAASEEPGIGFGTAAPPRADSATAATPATASAAPASSAAAPTSAPVAVPLTNNAVIKELAEMKARIARLEAELKANNGAADADHDADALRTAEGVAAGGGSSSSIPEMQVAPALAPAAAPAPPEISAQTTTKGEPFDGDWTWLNSNGHAVDSPMSTKYFTPEFRADANYILDYNHPHDDTMGALRRASAPTSGSLSRSALAETSASTMCVGASSPWTACSLPPPRATMPAPAAANGIWLAPTSTCQRHGAAITGM